MLCALAVGLASGVGLYALAVFSTVFLMLALGVIESFEKGVKRFDLKVKAGEQDRRAAAEDRGDPAPVRAAVRAAARRPTKRCATTSRCRSTSNAIA